MGSRYRERFNDPEGDRHGGLPTYMWGDAPDNLLTKRQLEARRLRPGGQEPVAQIIWRQWGADAFAWLYDVEKALPKRTPSPAVLEAVGKALAARRTCGRCGQDAGYCLPKTGPYTGLCNDCTLPGASGFELAAAALADVVETSVRLADSAERAGAELASAGLPVDDLRFAAAVADSAVTIAETSSAALAGLDGRHRPMYEAVAAAGGAPASVGTWYQPR